MVMMERFGSPATRLMSVMKNFQVPVRSVQPGDRVLIITDDAMDPLVWQGAMAAINEKGGEPVLCMWPRLETYGDENSWLCGGEMALGLSRLCQPDADSVRSWKKHYGAMHFGIGHGADRGKIVSVLRLEGIIEKITIVIDDTVLCDNGKIMV